MEGFSNKDLEPRGTYGLGTSVAWFARLLFPVSKHRQVAKTKLTHLRSDIRYRGGLVSPGAAKSRLKGIAERPNRLASPCGSSPAVKSCQ
jgi:hypothetical protein